MALGRVAAVCIFVLITFFGSWSSLRAQDANLLTNSQFEQSVSGRPSGWHFDAAAARGTLALVSTPSRGGNALALRPSASNTTNYAALNTAQAISAAPHLGKTLEISGWLASDGGASAAVTVWVIAATGAIMASGEVSGTGGLAYQRTTFLVPSDSTALYLIIACRGLGTSGGAYFDDVALRPAAVALEPTSLTAQVTVQAKNTIRTIPRTLFGSNLTWPWGGTLIWDFRTNNYHPDLEALAANAKFSLLRFPGGHFADFYRWRDGIGAQSARKATQIEPGGGSSVHSFGTDEALTFAERAGARLLMTVNANTGTASEAADWVRYVNQQSPARRVTYWEVGNEFYIKNDSPANASITPSTYAARLAEFSQAMRAADPSVKILAIGAENFGRYSSSAYPDWNRTVLTAAAQHADYLALHNSYFPVLIGNEGVTDVRAVYKSMLAAPLLIKKNLETVAQQIAAHGGGRNIRLAVTEWGPMFDYSASSPWTDHIKTLGSALFVASTMKAYLETPQLDIATGFKLNDIGFAGWFGSRHADILTRVPSTGEFIATAPQMAFELFSKRFGSTLVQATVVSPTYDSAAVGMTDAVVGVPYLEAVSSLSGDRNTLYLIVINKHFDKPVTGRMSLQGFLPSGAAGTWTLNGASIDANTGTQLPAGAVWAPQMQDSVQPRFYLGGPSEVTVTQGAAAVSGSFDYVFPAHSVTAFEIRGSMAP
ncbi:MAG TPA: hypothetical protein DEH78_21005 [Solibacterales bacterium]|nr:hypothetical protein [Bryobacterales bacterium]